MQNQKPMTTNHATKGVSKIRNFVDRFYMTITALLVVLASILIVAFAYGAESTTQRDAPTVRFYTPDAKSAATASTYGNTTKFYAPDGKLVGSATRQGAAMKKLLLAAMLLAIAGPAFADDYCSNHFCLPPPALPPSMYVAPSGTSTLGGPTMANAPSWLRRPQPKTRMRRH
jgi:hypothetical protein